MKLLRWAVAGASAYAIYKYTIGKKAQGEDVFVSPEGEGGELKPPRPQSGGQPKRPRGPKQIG